MEGNSSMKGGVLQTLPGQASEEGGSIRFVRDYLSAMAVLDLESDPRCRALTQCYGFFEGSQHDHHGSDWNGLPRDPGVGYMQERLKPQGFVPVNSTPHAYRKPDAPVPLARQVTSRFTEMLLGEGRRPALRSWSSPATQDYLEAAFREASLWDVLSQARDVAGACGSSLVALGIVAGHFEAEVLRPSNVWVAEWCPESPGWVPNVVIEQTKVVRQVWERANEGGGLPGPRDRGRLVSKLFYKTRAWTPEEIIYYRDVPCDDVPDEAIPVAKVVPHKFGACPVVWYQNTRRTESPDGEPDCSGAWPLLDKLDRLQSQVYKAAVANADPTLVIKEDRQNRRRNNLIQKGSSHVIPLSPDGEAKYLEMQGTSVEIGLKAIDKMIHEVLQTVECVVIHPDTAKAYQSGEALQILWRSMESKANRLRVTLGSAVREISYLLLTAAKNHGVANMEKVGSGEDRPGILLPPRKVIREVEADTSKDDPMIPAAPASVEVSYEAHEPGPPETYVDMEWPPYWTPTAAQVAQMAQAMAVASAQKQAISEETAIRQLAQMLGNDGDEEVRRVALERSEGMRAMIEGLGGMGLDDEDEDEDLEPPDYREDLENEDAEEADEDEDAEG